MAVQFKYSIARGQRHKDVVVAAGAVVGTDTVAVNVDATSMTQADFLQCLDEVRIASLQGKWFPL